MKPQTSINQLEMRNKAVIASYLLIVKSTKQLIAKLPQELLRHTIELDSKDYPEIQPKLHELITPLCYLCLREDTDRYVIQFGFDQSIEFAHFTGAFVRLIYKLTMRQVTAVDIEDCIVHYSITTDTSFLIDEVQWKHPCYPVDIIAHKPAKSSRKMLSVA